MTVQGALNSSPGESYRVDFFSNPTCDPAGYGEGAVPLGSSTVTTDLVGNAPVAFTTTSFVPSGQFITATATQVCCGSTLKSTSEFSACIPVGTVPGETSELAWCAGSSTCLEWTEQAGATSYSVYRGTSADLPNLLTRQIDSCIQWGGSDSTTRETVVGDPPPGSLYWYLVRGASDCGEGSAGNATAGPRIQDGSDPCP